MSFLTSMCICYHLVGVQSIYKAGFIYAAPFIQVGAVQSAPKMTDKLIIRQNTE